MTTPARLPHAAGRPGAPDARGHGCEDPRAGRAGRRGRRARRPCRRRRAATQLQRAAVRRADPSWPRDAFRRCPEPGAFAEAGRRRCPHGAALRDPRRPAHAAPARAAAAVVHALEGDEAASAGRASGDHGRHRRPPLVSVRIAEGRPDRARYRHVRLLLRRARSHRAAARRGARTHVARQGARDDRAGRGARRSRPRAPRAVPHRRGACRGCEAERRSASRSSPPSITPTSRRCSRGRTCS